MADFLDVPGVSQKEREEFILQDISFTVQPFQHTAIMGETGSGKSSLMKILAGHVSPFSGDVYFKGERLLRIPEEKLIRGHKGIAYLNQQSELPGFLTVSQVLEYVNELPSDESLAIYEVCRIGHLLARKTDQLSGGEKQRIALARLLTTKPSLLLLDEPFSNMDTIHKALLKDVMRDIGERLGVTSIMIAHDPQDTLSWARQVIVMRAGRIVQTGTAREIYDLPRDEYVAALGGGYNYIAAADAEKFLNLWGFEHISADMIVRPEQLLISANDDDPLFNVTDISFMGSYQLLGIEQGQHRLKLLSGTTGYSVGQPIRVTLPVSAIHFF